MAQLFLYKKYSSQQLNKRKNTVDKWAMKAIRSFQSFYPVNNIPTIYVLGSLLFNKNNGRYLIWKTHSRQFFAPYEAIATLFLGPAGSALNINEEFVLILMNQSVGRCRLELASKVWHDMAKLYLIQLEGTPDHFRKYCEIHDDNFLRSTNLLYDNRSDEMYMHYDRSYRVADDATFFQQLGYWLWLEFFCHVLSLRMKQKVGYYHIPGQVLHEFKDFDSTFWIYF